MCLNLTPGQSSLFLLQGTNLPTDPANCTVTLVDNGFNPSTWSAKAVGASSDGTQVAILATCLTVPGIILEDLDGLNITVTVTSGMESTDINLGDVPTVANLVVIPVIPSPVLVTGSTAVVIPIHPEEAPASSARRRAAAPRARTPRARRG
jgi:hypothetical protein